MTSQNKKILITGVAGFIGSAVAKKLINEGESVIGIDNINNYYDKKLKIDRLKSLKNISLENNSNFVFRKIDIKNINSLKNIFKTFDPKLVLNLAAQAGVRFSITNPESYINSNLVGFSNILECCKIFNIEHLVYASSSSVYGGNKNLPFMEDQQVNHPISLYAATKKSNELMAHSYSHLFNLPCTALRLFTVYGPWGRPDMAPMIFTKSIINKEPINIFNYGNMSRDFTFIDDITEALIRCCFKKATPNDNFDSYNPLPATSFAPHRIFNVGNSKPIKIIKFIETLEDKIGIKAIKVFKELQPGDVISTCSDNLKLYEWINFRPKFDLDKGLSLFVDWYKKYYKV